jgi:hypothetical protein
VNNMRAGSCQECIIQSRDFVFIYEDLSLCPDIFLFYFMHLARNGKNEKHLATVKGY